MKKIIFPLCVASLLFGGCAKEGLDGEATLVITPQHHGVGISSTAAYRDSVYIKFGVDEIPEDPTHDYDAVVVGQVGESHIHVHNVKWGKYSLYCAAWDTAQNERVVGGITYKMKRSERTGEHDIIVPVSED